MKEIAVKALMHCGAFVDPTRLPEGLYIRTIPAIYEQNITIDLLCEWAKGMIDPSGECCFDDRYFDNLRACELVEVTIIVPE